MTTSFQSILPPAKIENAVKNLREMFRLIMLWRKLNNRNPTFAVNSEQIKTFMNLIDDEVKTLLALLYGSNRCNDDDFAGDGVTYLVNLIDYENTVMNDKCCQCLKEGTIENPIALGMCRKHYACDDCSQRSIICPFCRFPEFCNWLPSHLMCNSGQLLLCIAYAYHVHYKENTIYYQDMFKKVSKDESFFLLASSCYWLTGRKKTDH